MRALIFSLIFAVTFSFSLSSQPIPQGINWPFTICGKGTWTMQNLTLDHIVTRNQDDNANAISIADDYTQFKKVDVKVTLNGLFLHSQTLDYDKTFDQGDMIDFLYTTFIPSFAPAGTYVLSYSFKDGNDKQNGCFSFSFKL